MIEIYINEENSTLISDYYTKLTAVVAWNIYMHEKIRRKLENMWSIEFVMKHHNIYNIQLNMVENRK